MDYAIRHLRLLIHELAGLNRIAGDEEGLLDASRNSLSIKMSPP
jgi:hypothetical protein